VTAEQQRENDRPTVSRERQKLLAQIAGMYYERGLSQQEIAETLRYSRSAISRLLTEARETGIVEIRVHHPLERSQAAEEALQAAFPALQHAQVTVCSTLTYWQTLRHLGAEAAQMVEGLVDEGTLLGVSWGTAVYEVASALTPERRSPGMTVVQLIGALGTADPEIDGPELARMIAQAYGGRYQIMPAPFVVDSQALRDALMDNRRLREVLQMARSADVAIVGIGTVDPAMSSLVRAGYLTRDEIEAVAAEGAVGDVCGIHFDEAGCLLNIPLNNRVVGIEPDSLAGIPTVIGVATGDAKAPAILGALRAGLVNALFTDEATAERVLRRHRSS
jgi:deoxyribonucleoside regulator